MGVRCLGSVGAAAESGAAGDLGDENDSSPQRLPRRAHDYQFAVFLGLSDRQIQSFNPFHVHEDDVELVANALPRATWAKVG